MKAKLTKLSVSGFKSICALDNFKLNKINILIGSNGAGKSNFISFFHLMNWMMASPGNLQEYILQLGGANAVLFDGAQTTESIKAELNIETKLGENNYFFRLAHGGGDVLRIMEERYRYSRFDFPSPADWTTLGAGHSEAEIINAAKTDKTANTILSLLRGCVVHQFHNTSRTSRMRGKWDKEDNLWLKEDGANIAAFLLKLKSREPKYYWRIVETIRLILPFFADFDLVDEYGKILLRWRELNTDVVFNAGQASDGMLRVIALVALLGQPEQRLPDVLILDEPELGLHPYAIEIISGMLRSVSQFSQIVIATQSASLVNYFDPEDIVVVDRDKRKSDFRRLDSSQLREWLVDYSMAELWEKNLIGGRPAR
ncbi:MAG: chromosome segregation protein SMC [Nitrospinae bacterium CG22_combo_CG10-13_8_21_14_all_47_10]|nr:MAG: chromosome segregation protein SMC [Nitrospinae bacterium CG22_combo_CG10-13_8_21_14_all_47_10]